MRELWDRLRPVERAVVGVDPHENWVETAFKRPDGLFHGLGACLRCVQAGVAKRSKNVISQVLPEV